MLLAFQAALETFATVPFVAVPFVAVARAYKRLKKLVPEVALCRGSAAGEGITGDGSYSSLYSGFWALVLGKSGTLKLGRLVGSSWIQVAPLSVLPVLVGARHISMAFDQAARPVIAWQNGNQVFVRQYDVNISDYQIFTFAGVDPVLLMDATINADTPNSDVLLGHLSITRDSFVMRAQRELYATARSLPVPPNSILDKAFVAGITGRFIGNGWSVSTEAYPYLAADQLTTLGFNGFVGGNLQTVVEVYDVGLDVMANANFNALTAGDLSNVVELYDAGLDALTGQFGALTAGDLSNVVELYDAGLDVVANANFNALTAGNLSNIVVVHDSGLDVLTNANFNALTGGALYV